MSRITKFKKPKDRKYIIDGVLSEGTMSSVIATSGTGKSFNLEWLAMCVVYGYPYLGHKTHACNVTLIDQDTPEDTLNERLYEYSQFMESQGYSMIGILEVLPMKDLSINDGTLLTAVEKSNSKLICIDCLRSVCRGIDMSKGMEALNTFKQKATRKDGISVLINHHISEHKALTVDKLMTSENHGDFAMDDSRIIQNMDSYFIVANPTRGSKVIDKFYIRPISKRYSITLNPCIVQYHKNGNGAMIEYVKDYDYSPQIHKDMIEVLKEYPNGLTHKKLYEDIFAHMYGDNAIRIACAELLESGKITKCKGGEKNTAFVWKVNNE